MDPGLTMDECLKGYIPVELSDFDLKSLEQDWAKEFQRIIQAKKPPPKVKPNHLELIFTDRRQDVPADQKPINQQEQAVENQHSFIKMIKAQVKVLTPDQWLVFFSQVFYQAKQEGQETYLSRNTWDWQMAILDHQGKSKKTTPQFLPPMPLPTSRCWSCILTGPLMPVAMGAGAPLCNFGVLSRFNKREDRFGIGFG